jgi:hypothetical protein
LAHLLVGAVAVLLGSGCSKKSGGPTDAGNDGVSPPQGCGGTITASGTTPSGPFTAESVSVVYDCGNRIVVSAGDAAHGLVIVASAALSLADGGMQVVAGDLAATGELDSLGSSAVLARTSGTLTVTAADYLAADAGVGGQATGSFSFMQDGFSLTGQFSSPYCRHVVLCGI